MLASHEGRRMRRPVWRDYPLSLLQTTLPAAGPTPVTPSRLTRGTRAALLTVQTAGTGVFPSLFLPADALSR